MTVDAWITLAVVVAAIGLFATEKLAIDLVAILVMVCLITTGVVDLETGLSGFSNSATLTVAFMFVISAAILKTGSMQFAAGQLTRTFKNHYSRGVALLMAVVSGVSAFINNTPVVAVMIPVTMQIAKGAGRPASKLLIPVSYASIFGGTCTLIGTSTNILVSGIMEQKGLPPISMFQITGLGLCFLGAGSLFMMTIGQKLLPNREAKNTDELQVSAIPYLAQIEIMAGSRLAGQSIFGSALVRELDLEIIELQRADGRFNLPQGDTVLLVGDVLKVRSNIEKLKMMKDSLRISVKPVGIEPETHDAGKGSLVELIIPTNSELEGKTLREFDFRRRFRAAPLAIRHREEVVNDQLHEVRLRAGDVILVEMKNQFLDQWQKNMRDENPPFIILSREGIVDFDRKRFALVMAIVLGVIVTASIDLMPIALSTLIGVCALVLTRCLTMKEVYKSIQWPIVFLMAGALCMGMAMDQSGLAALAAKTLVSTASGFGPIVILSAIYLATSLITEVMSNTATAAVMTPLAIATAIELGVSPMPFAMATLFAASASFMTPVGYQCNTMVYSAGGYKFFDFFKVGVWINLMFWLMATVLIPVFFPL